MKKRIIAVLLMAAITLSGCSGSGSTFSKMEEEYKSGEKQLEVEVMDRLAFAETVSVFPDLILNYNNFYQINSKEILGGKQIDKIQGYKEEVAPFYEACYEVIYYDDSKVTEDVKPVWKEYKDLTSKIVEMLDNCAKQKGDEAVAAAEEMFVYIGERTNEITKLVPKESIGIRKPVIVDGFAEVTVKSLDYRSQVYPSDTSGFYTYTDVQNPNSIYLACNFDLTNLQTESGIGVTDFVNCTATFEGGYQYTGYGMTDEGNRFSAFTSILPLSTVDAWYLIEIPTSLQGKPYELEFDIGGTKFEWN